MLLLERHFKHILAAIILIKLALCFWFPITSDEAYFFIWGQYPDIHYYDHPPMTGWVMALFGLMGRHIFFSRLFAIFSGLIIAAGIYRLVRDGFNAPEKARLVTLCYLAAPLHSMYIFITTDTPLILFTALSGFALYYALRHENSWLALLSGFFWGAAILSKYLGGLLLIAVLLCLVLRRERRSLYYLLLWILGALPLVTFHLYANYQNCWTNILFNVINRNQHVTWEISGLFEFVLSQVYIATPWLLFYLAKNIKELIKAIKHPTNLFVYLFCIPVGFLGMVALHHTGLHWTLAFYPFLFLLIVHLPIIQINRIAIFSMIFSLAQIGIIATLLALPAETFKNHPDYHDIVLCKFGDELYEKVKAQYGINYVFATEGYYTAGAMTYHSDQHFSVFLDDSKHGRHDDKLTNYKELDGKDFLILWTRPVHSDYTPYFETVKKSQFTLRHETFYVAVGRRFRYSAYRDLFLKKINSNWYTCPDFLPQGKCFFKETYFENDSEP